MHNNRYYSSFLLPVNSSFCHYNFSLLKAFLGFIRSQWTYSSIQAKSSVLCRPSLRLFASQCTNVHLYTLTMEKNAQFFRLHWRLFSTPTTDVRVPSSCGRGRTSRRGTSTTHTSRRCSRTRLMNRLLRRQYAQLVGWLVLAFFVCCLSLVCSEKGMV